VKQDGGVHGGGGIGINKKSFPYDEEEEEENNIDNIGKQQKWAPTMPYCQRNHQNQHEHSPDYHEDHRH